ncbi:PREDICTED: lysozyme D-like [Rhagoletis zephyria]|uniref:lysozyme D-like n=1 Tax=Rhagoletis zephyria TaxID=28612 RepID=UPI0008118666|nr:PREDICTED: lysozyme D-like [Rhagoletis zephyria]
MKIYAVLLIALAIAAPAFGVVLNRCSLAHEMPRLGVLRDKLARWACIAEQESSYRSDVIGPTYNDGSHDYDICQINDYFWCQPASGLFSYNQCHVGCNELLMSCFEPCINLKRGSNNYSPIKNCFVKL